MVNNDFSQDGLGLPHMGLFSNQWFNASHIQRNVPCLDHHVQVPETKRRDPFWTYERWPIPTSRANSMFQPNTWDLRIRQFGSL